MTRKVYRSLDKPSAFFGIRGRFIWLLAIMVIILLMVAVIFSKTIGTIPASLVFFGGAIAAYSIVISTQAKMSERAFMRFISSKRIPRALRLSPSRVMTYFNMEEQ